MYTNDDDGGQIFDPTSEGNDAQTYINDLSLIEIPADYKVMVKPGLGMTVFGDYAYNIDGDDRRKAWIELSKPHTAFIRGIRTEDNRLRIT